FAMEKGSAHSGRPYILFMRETHVNAYIIKKSDSEIGQIYCHTEKGLPTVADPTFYLHRQKILPACYGEGSAHSDRPHASVAQVEIMPGCHRKRSSTFADHTHNSHNQ
ncbi:hypothetical protein PanWU01x14_107660, partial [Parasponia andersonii]